ncbi:MAG TPA: hypothetical protein VKI43_03435 [Vicinamibacterales bacterium]|nr:hypothetical protein [Vicinamibacterales bacterium]
MTQSSPGSPNPFAVTPHADPPEAQPPAPRSRHMSLPLRMDDGEIKTFELPAALANSSQFSVNELERLTRAYAEALGLIGRQASA